MFPQNNSLRVWRAIILFVCSALLVLAAVPRAEALQPQIANAGFHVLVLRSDGTVWAWGINASGQLGDGSQVPRDFPAQVPNFSGVVSIAARKFTSLAAKSDGTVWQWGNFSDLLTDYLVPDQIAGLDNVLNVATAGDFSYALKSDGTVWAWGTNAVGQLGDGTAATVPKQRNPVLVLGLTGVTAIAATGSGGVALKADGTVWQWGGSTLGDGSYAPVQVAGLANVVQISAGEAHKLALKSDGTVWSWGVNSLGQLGDGTQTSTANPVQVIGLSGATLIAAGAYSSFAKTNDGRLWAWGGWNGAGPLNAGFLADGTSASSASSAPVVVGSITNPLVIAPSIAVTNSSVAVLQENGNVLTWGMHRALGTGLANAGAHFGTVALTGVDSVAASDAYLLAQRQDGTVWAWGWNTNGQLGDGTTTQRATPRQVVGLQNVVQVRAGAAHSLALDTDGSVWAWGWNSYGQLGDGGVSDRATAAKVIGISGVTAISAGGAGAHALALKADGTVWAWGRNDYGQLGDGSTENRSTPVQVSALSGIVAIATGSKHSLALRSDGAVMAWGRNSSGQVGDGTTVDRLLPVAVTVPPGITSIAAGDIFSLAVRFDGTLWVWGDNSHGQLGGGITPRKLTPTQNTALDSVIAAAAGYSHSVVIRNDGNVWAFGSSGGNRRLEYCAGYADVEQPITVEGGLVYVAAGRCNTAAVKADGTLLVWGDPLYGELGNAGRDSFWLPAPVSLTPGGEAFNVFTTTLPRTDSQAPTEPTNVSASPLSASQVNVSWSASADNVGVTVYKVFRNGALRETVAAPALNFSDSGLVASSTYYYGVAACDAAGNCSAQSFPAITTTNATTGVPAVINLIAGWNLMGNSNSDALDVAAAFGDTSKITTVWKWLSTLARWAFYAPSLGTQQLADYAASKGYEVLSGISAGEGFWVNAKTAFTTSIASGTAIGSSYFQTPISGQSRLLTGWNLIAIADNKTPSQFNTAIGATQPSAGEVPLNLTTLWAWDANLANWYFYAPGLAAMGGTALADYIAGKGFLDFGSKVLLQTTGFWVNKP